MRELWLFTTRFPRGLTEPFLENELPVLAERFERVRIFPLLPDTGARAVPANVEVTDLFSNAYKAAGPLRMLLSARALREAIGVTRASAPEERVWRERRRDTISRLRQALQRMQVLRQRMGPAYDPASVRLYSYWTADWATVLALWQLHDPRVRFVSRMHGFDLYADRAQGEWHPFRALHLRTVDRVFVASQAGLDHLCARHPEHADRFTLARLGTRDHGIAPWRPGAVLRLASCANLVPLKRVHLISEALMGFAGEVEWTHFGDGPERERIEAIVRALPANVRVRLMGAVPNSKLLQWYASNPVDLFVHTSASEGGVPVALQEAASFGIPLLAFDAGGVREIVNDRTGVLLPADPDAIALRRAMEAHLAGERATAAFREGVRRAWSEGFRSEAAFGTFADHLLRN